MRISAIAAVGENRELGKDNKLLWHIPGELPRFKRLTTGHPIIMGRKTFESIGRILPNRTNIIITRDPSYSVEGGVVVHSLQEAIGFAKKQPVIPSEVEGSSQPVIPAPPVIPANPDLIGRTAGIQENGSPIKSGMTRDKNEVFVIGGGQIFAQALPMIDRLYLTIVHKTFIADAFFPDYRAFAKVVKKEDHQTEEFSYTFLTLEK